MPEKYEDIRPDLQKIRAVRPVQPNVADFTNGLGVKIINDVLVVQYPDFEAINDETMLEIIELAGPFFKSLNDMCRKIGWPYHKVRYRLKVTGCSVVAPIQLIRPIK